MCVPLYLSFFQIDVLNLFIISNNDMKAVSSKAVDFELWGGSAHTSPLRADMKEEKKV